MVSQGSPGSGSRRATSIPVARIHHAGKPGEGNHVPLIDKGARLADKADMGLARDPISLAIATLDYGNPHDAEMSKVLRAWSPYQNVKDGERYPTLLLDSGSNDPRCPPWHVRKMAARMQQANAGSNPVLMRVRQNAGHGAVGAEAQHLQDADFLAFFADQLGLVL